MFEFFDSLSQQPFAFLLALGCNLWLLQESAFRMKELRYGFAAIVYATVALWYLFDPLYREYVYQHLSTSELSDAYLQVLIFLISFRYLLPKFTPATPSSVLRAFDPRVLSNGRVAGVIFLAWLVLFTFGVSRMNFNVIGALFPMKGRTSWGEQLWARPRLGGKTDFAISAVGYLYEFLCSLFGLVAVGTRNPKIRRCMILMIALTWPSYVLGGARHKIVAVATPSILAILIIKRWKREQQLIFLGVCFLVINTLMLIVIEYRNFGWDQVFSQEFKQTAARDVDTGKHQGLNMTEELVYMNRYQADGRLPVEWGFNYFANVANIIPRSLWRNKPNPGERYAELRVGFFRGSIAATISNGLIGQGVANFGKWLGPIAPAVILSLFARWMCGFMKRGDLFLRACIVLICLGTTPNFGRDLTTLPLLPVIFGAIAVIAYERYWKPKRRSTILATQTAIRNRP